MVFGFLTQKKATPEKYEPPKVATNFTQPPQPEQSPPPQPKPPVDEAPTQPHSLNQQSGRYGGFEDEDMFSTMTIKTPMSSAAPSRDEDSHVSYSSGRRNSASSESSVSSSSSLHTPKMTSPSNSQFSSFESNPAKRKPMNTKSSSTGSLRKDNVQTKSKTSSSTARGRKKGNNVLGVAKAVKQEEVTQDEDTESYEDERSAFDFVNHSTPDRNDESDQVSTDRESHQTAREIEDTDSEDSEPEESDISLSGLTIHSRQQSMKALEEEREREQERLRLEKLREEEEEKERIRRIVEEERKRREREAAEREKLRREEEERRRKEEEADVATKTEREYETLRGVVTESIQKQFLTPARQNFIAQQQLLELQRKLNTKLKASEQKIPVLEHKLSEATRSENFELADELERSLNTLKSEMTTLRVELQTSTKKFQSYYEQMSKLDRDSSNKNAHSNKVVQDFVSRTNTTFDSLGSDWNVKRSLNDERITNERDRIERQEKSLELDAENVSKRRDRLRAQIDSSTVSERQKVENLQREAANLQEDIDELERKLREKRAMLKSTHENIQLTKSIIEQYEKKFSAELVLLDREQRETDVRKQDLQRERVQHEQAVRKWQKEINKWENQCSKRDKVLQLAKNLTSDVEKVTGWKAQLAKLQKARMEFVLLDQSSSEQNLFLDLQKYEKQNSILQHELNTCETQLNDMREQKMKMQNELPELNAKKNAAAKNRKFKDAEQFKLNIKNLEDQIAKIEPECNILEDKMTSVEKSLKKNAKLLASVKDKYTQALKSKSESYISKVLVPELLQLQHLLVTNDNVDHSDRVVTEARDIILLAKEMCEAEIQDSRVVLEWSDDVFDDLVRNTKIRLGLHYDSAVELDTDVSEPDGQPTSETIEHNEGTVAETSIPVVVPNEVEALKEEVDEESSEPIAHNSKEEVEENLVEKKISLQNRVNAITAQIAEINALIEVAVDQEDFERCDQLDSEAQILTEEMYAIEVQLQQLSHIDVTASHSAEEHELTTAEVNEEHVTSQQEEEEQEQEEEQVEQEEQIQDNTVEENQEYVPMAMEHSEKEIYHDEPEEVKQVVQPVEKQELAEEEELQEEETQNQIGEDEEHLEEQNDEEEEETSAFSFI